MSEPSPSCDMLPAEEAEDMAGGKRGRPPTPPEEREKRWRKTISLSVSPEQQSTLKERHRQEGRPGEDFSAFLRRLLGLEE